MYIFFIPLHNFLITITRSKKMTDFGIRSPVVCDPHVAMVQRKMPHFVALFVVMGSFFAFAQQQGSLYEPNDQVIDLTDGNVNLIFNSNALWVVEFYDSSNCGQCKIFSSTYKSIAETFKGTLFTFYKHFCR